MAPDAAQQIPAGYPVQGNEHRHLNKNWQTATHWVDLLLLVQLHHLLRELLAIFAMLLFQVRHLWSQLAHFRHGTEAGCVQRVEQCFYTHGQQDDGPAPVTHDGLNKLQQGKQRLSQEPQPAKVHGQLQAVGQLFQTILILWTSVQICTKGSCLTRGNRYVVDKADKVVLLIVRQVGVERMTLRPDPEPRQSRSTAAAWRHNHLPHSVQSGTCRSP